MMPVPNTAYARPPDEIEVDSSELLAAFRFGGYELLLKPVAKHMLNVSGNVKTSPQLMFDIFRKLFGNISGVRNQTNNPEIASKCLEDAPEDVMLKKFQPEIINQSEFVWCLVGNIIGEHLFGENKEIKRGTKHFTPKTKVYCFPTQWGDGYEKIKVIGRNRNNKRFISVVIQSKYVANWRLQKVYNPYIIQQMIKHNGWTDSDDDKETISEMLKWLPDRTINNKPE